MKRLFTVCLLFGALVALTLYGYRAYPELRLSACLQDPLRYDGAQLIVGNEATVQSLLPDGFVIHQMGRSLRVLGNPGEAQVGDFVRMQVTFHKEGHLTLHRLYVAKKRRAKVAVSLLPALLVAGLCIRAYRFDRSRACLVERNKCLT